MKPPIRSRPIDATLRTEGIKRLLLAVLTGLILLTAFLVHRVGTTMGRLERQEAINGKLILLEDILQDLLSAETGQRGYLLTASEPYLLPYTNAASNLPQHMQALLAHGTPDSVENDRVQRLDKLIGLKMTELRESLQLAQSGRRAEALQLVQGDLGRLYMAEARAIIDELSAGMKLERVVLSKQFKTAATRARIFLLLGTSSLILFIGLALWIVWRTMQLNTALVQRLEAEATQDALTGLPNRRYLGEWLAQNIAVATRANSTVGIFFIDLDGFKAINDRKGHEAGDRVLVAISQCLRDTLRQSDFVARLGGDEFAVVTIDRVGDASLLRLGERLIEAISTLDLQPDADTGALGASVGVAVFPSDGDSPEALLDAADRAMYRAKRSGKGRVKLAGELQLAPGHG